MSHWQSGGKALGIGHSSVPRKTFKDATLFPQIFPWLFPYGLGGIGASTVQMSDDVHKRNLLMYHDKRFHL